ncbi:voltage-gated potassium channel KCNC1-like [Ambystoma mexicanum]|uniref:voltage-gated potassium channel KCNC1-like n=1 Tax=Ambystoma mexicanum TaxID=8296 RepID=UPI0037E8827A
MEASNNRITINIGGVRFETYSSTLQKFPGTKLSTLTEPHAYSTYDFDHKLKEFFFDRNAKAFACVLEYYRTGHLHFPDDLCRSVLVEELSFWEISETQLARCCWLKLNIKESNLEDINGWDDRDQNEAQGLITATGRTDFSWRARWQPKIWALFNTPFSSLTAMCVTVISLLFTIGVIIIFFEETKDQFLFESNITHYSSSSIIMNLSGELAYTKSNFLLYLELLCVLFFIAEFCLRVFFCPDKKKFIGNLLNIADFISFFPVFIELLAFGRPKTLAKLWIILGFMRVTYIIRLVRFFKLLEAVFIIKVVSGTLNSAVREILILLLVLTFETLFFGTIIFYAEFQAVESQFFHERYFGDIYASCWWAIVTLTTVGYGDMYPISTPGKIVAALTAMSGILTIVIPIPILIIKFQRYYSIAKAQEKLTMSRRKHPQ